MIVLDTHFVIWDALTPDRLSPQARKAIDQANQQYGVILADISLWEITILIEKGRVQVDVDCQTFINLVLNANKTTVRPITSQIAALAVQLPSDINQDPADRLITATALVEDVPLVTADRNLRAAPLISTLW